MASKSSQKEVSLTQSNRQMKKKTQCALLLDDVVSAVARVSDSRGIARVGSARIGPFSTNTGASRYEYSYYEYKQGPCYEQNIYQLRFYCTRRTGSRIEF
eukprot:scaffold561621_cov17-Prasinocladus_malaysianus.AAC.1